MDTHKRRKLRNIFDAIVWNAPELEKICKAWGNQHMLTIAMEECAELIQAVSKIKRNGSNPVDGEHLAEETADVLICICELFLMGYLDVNKTAKIFKEKVKRSMQRTQDYVKQLEKEAKYNGDF